MNSKWSQTLAAMPCILVLVLISGCEELPSAPSDEGRPIKMFTVGGSAGTVVREYPGTIAAAQEVQIGFEVPGQVVEFPVTAGQELKTGEVLAELEKTNFQATVDAAQAQVTAAEADFKRKQELVKIGGASKAALEESERRFTSAQSDLKTANKALADTVLKSPFDGVIANKLVQNFANVQQKQPIVTIQDPKWMELKVNIPEADAVLAVPGLSLEQRNQNLRPKVVVSVVPDREFPAQVSEFSTAADPTTRTYEVTFIFSRPEDVSLLPGMTARVVVSPKLGADSSNSFRVPVKTVAGDATGEAYVWVIDEAMKARKRTVSVGEMSGSMIQVLDGLQTGDRIALTGVHHLREGLLVSNWEAE